MILKLDFELDTAFPFVSSPFIEKHFHLCQWIGQRIEIFFYTKQNINTDSIRFSVTHQNKKSVKNALNP